MSAPVARPSASVTAQRRRLLLWLPILILGAVASLAGGPMITVFNSLDVLGLALMAVGLLGFVHEVER